MLPFGIKINTLPVTTLGSLNILDFARMDYLKNVKRNRSVKSLRVSLVIEQQLLYRIF